MAAALSAQQPAHAAQAKSKSSTASTGGRTGVKPAASANKTAAAKASSKSTTSKSSSSAPRTAASRRLVNGRWVSTSSRRPARPSKPAGQQHPEPGRYQEIQKALAERGYFKGEASGEWKDDSTEALKRFQADQKLPNDGKLNSLTLIGLGLGPKHEGGPLTPPPPPPSNLPPATLPPISPETLPAPTKPQ